MKDSIPVFIEGAKVNFRLYGHLTPVFAAVIDGQPQILGVSWSNSQDKDAFAKQIQNWIAENRLTEFIMVVEAWAATNSDNVQEHFQKHGTIQDFPDRKEIVIVRYCSANEEIDYTTDIIRGTIPHLGDWHKIEREVKFSMIDLSTRFQGFFLKSKVKQN